MNRDAFLRTTRQFFHERIPITREMGVEVESFDDSGLVLTAPLAANHNHLGTAFGGSLAALATLAGYGMVWLMLEDQQAHVVIKESQLRYLRPVTATLRAVCTPPGDHEWERFIATFRQRGKARIRLEVVIFEAGQPCVEFNGTFVALR
jgi:thioesterase domain-containing protein